MSIDLRLFLIVRRFSSEYVISVHKGLETLVESWEGELNSEQKVSGLFHIGRTRPETSEIDHLLQAFPGHILISESARWLLPPGFTEQMPAVGEITEGPSNRAMSIYIGRSGWTHGDDVHSEAELLNESEDRASETLDGEQSENSFSLDFIFQAVRVSQKSDYEAIREKISTDNHDKLDYLRFCHRLALIDRSDLFELLEIAPQWVFTVPFESMHLSSRIIRVLNREFVSVPNDLLELSRREILDWEGFGLGCYRDLAGALLDYIQSCDPSQFGTLNGFQIDFGSGDLFEVLRRCPNWLLDWPIDEIRNNLRVRNALANHGIARPRDLLVYDQSTILTWKNFGRRSYNDLAETLIAHYRKRMSMVSLDDRHLRTGIDSDEIDDISLDIFTFDESLEEMENSLENILECFGLDCRDFDYRSHEIIKRRLGYYGKAETLDEIGTSMGVTRERIRQVEKKCFDKIKENGRFTTHLNERMRNLFQVRKDPLYLDLIEIEDAWFKGAAQASLFIGNVISTFSSEEFKTLTLNGRRTVSRINDEEWGTLVQSVISFCRSRVGSGLSLDDVRIFIESQLVRRRSAELTDVLVKTVEPSLHFITRTSGLNELVSIGDKVPAIVTAVLAEAESPLHYSEIWKRCVSHSDKSIELRRVHGSLGQLNAWYFGRGIYGTSSHCQLSRGEILDVISECDSIVLSQDTRQWHASEILQNLVNDRPDISDILDKYVLNNILRDSKNLRYLGRMIWTSLDSDRKRIDITDAYVDILMREGSPLPLNELEARLTTDRGTGGFSLCVPTSRLIRVEPGVWGLIDRDFVLNAEERNSLLDVLCHLLESSNKGIPVATVCESLQSIGQIIPNNLTAYMILSIARTDPRFRLYRGQIIGLSIWNEPRAISVRDAFERMLETTVFPAPTDEIRLRVEKILERQLPNGGLYNLLREFNIKYDEEFSMWFKDSSDFDDDDGLLHI